MNSNDELIQAIDYTFQSPFVRKIVGVTVQEDQNRLDSESADKIKASSHMLGSIRNEHENARNVIIAAAHENPTKYLQTLTEYLENLENLKYVEVKIQKAQTCVISNLYKVGDRYEGTVSIFQYFTGRTKDNVIYRDRTQKDIKIYVDKVKDGSLGEFWQLKLGDVNVVETVKL